jgi:Uma2 family endonuclease
MDRFQNKYPISRLVSHLYSELKGSEYEALGSVTFVVDDTLVLEPDAYVHGLRNLKMSVRYDEYPAGVPDVAILLHSPAARIEDTWHEMRAYFQHGTRMVWLVHPNDQVLFVFDSDSSEPSVFSARQTLHLPEPFPQFAIPMQEIFLPRGCEALLA